MKIEYVPKNFKQGSLDIINQANEIIEEYQADGMDLTLRQLYYQFVSRDLIANKQTEYKRLGSIINDARLAGLVDWEAIEDRTRNVQSLSHWDNPGQIVRAAARSFRLDHWEGQRYRPEVWIEKEALVGIIAPICNELDVSYFACKGYVSQSEMWNAAQRFQRQANREQLPIIIHLGDHDPSGIDMTEDIVNRQSLFDGAIDTRRIALNMDQVEKYEPPPNPAKLTDSRCGKYIERYGRSSWELDALEPRAMRDLIKDKVLTYRNERTYKEVMAKEAEYRDILNNIEENWESL